MSNLTDLGLDFVPKNIRSCQNGTNHAMCMWKPNETSITKLGSFTELVNKKYNLRLGK